MNDLTVGLFIDEVISGVTDVDDLYLEHYGVKGMKWGVRKDRSRKNSNTRPSEKSDLSAKGYSVSKDGSISIKKGHTLQRVYKSSGKNKGETGSSGTNYFSFTTSDNQAYISMMGAGADSKFKFLRKLASDKVASFEVKENLKSPSTKEAFEIFNSIADKPYKGKVFLNN